jgi:AhpD family alkylhydroperoxidase
MAETNDNPIGASPSLYVPALEELIALEAVISAQCQSCSDPRAVEELVAVGAASGAKCWPCVEHHAQQARELGVAAEDLQMAVHTALATAARREEMDE